MKTGSVFFGLLLGSITMVACNSNNSATALAEGKTTKPDIKEDAAIYTVDTIHV